MERSFQVQNYLLRCENKIQASAETPMNIYVYGRFDDLR